MPLGLGPAGWFVLPYIYPQLVNFYRYMIGYNPIFGIYGWGFDELSYLKTLKQNLEAQLAQINKRIEELEG